MSQLGEHGEIIPYGATARQLAFARAFHEMGKARKAARAAGYRGSDNSLSVRASKLLANPKVQALLTDMKAKDAGLEATSGEPTDDELFNWLRREATTAKSDAARVNACAVIARLRGEKSEPQNTRQGLTEALLTLPTSVRWIVAEQCGVVDVLHEAEREAGLPFSQPVKICDGTCQGALGVGERRRADKSQRKTLAKPNGTLRPLITPVP